MKHEQIWAPWRLEYILSDKHMPEPDDSVELLPGADRRCFLCQAVPPGDDRPRLVIARTQCTVTVLNRYPYTNGHLLVAPWRHVAGLNELTRQEHLELSQTIAGMVDLLERTMRPEGFNVGVNLGLVAGAGMPEHLHWHIVPRWSGDTNFISSVAGIRCIPQSLGALWEALTDAQGHSEPSSR